MFSLNVESIILTQTSYTTSFHDSNQFEIFEHLCSMCNDLQCSCPDSVFEKDTVPVFLY